MKRNNQVSALIVLFLCLTIGCAFGVARAEDLPFRQQRGYTERVRLYLPSVLSDELTWIEEDIFFDAEGTPEEALLRELLSHQDTDRTAAWPGGGEITLDSEYGYTDSCGVATVNLGAAAWRLTPTERFVLGQAIADTLAGLGRVDAVNLLIDGRSFGLDEEGNIPVGCFVPDAADDPTYQLSRLIAQRASLSGGETRFRANTAIYYPSRAGHGIIGERRTIAYESLQTEDITQTLLEAMSGPPETIQGSAEMPDLVKFLLKTPEVTRNVQNEQTITLTFSENLNEELSQRGVLRSVFAAAIVTTLTSFLPDTSVCRIVVGEEAISGMVPVGIYVGRNETLTFENGEMHWRDFCYFQLTKCDLFFVDDQERLTRSSRYLPSAWADSPYRLLSQLFEGPSYYDFRENLSSSLPVYLTEEDILDIGRDGDRLYVNLSGGFQGACSNYDSRQEQNVIFAIVNTLTNIPNCRRVQFFIEGESVETLSGSMSLTGWFMRNPDYRP